MVKKALRILFALILKHPMTVIVLVGILTIASLIAVFYLSIETDVANLLPSDSPVLSTFNKALSTFRTFDFTFVVIEAEEAGQAPSPPELQRRAADLLIQAAETIAPALDNPAYVYSVDYKSDPRLKAFYIINRESRLSCLLMQTDLEAGLAHFAPDMMESYMVRLARHLQSLPLTVEREHILTDPFDLARLFDHRMMVSRGPTYFPMRRGYFLSADGMMLLMVLRPLEPASDLKFSTDLMLFLNRVRDVLIRNNPDFRGKVRVSYYGTHVETVASARTIRHDLLETLLASFIGVLVLFFVGFRRKKALIYVGVPLLVGILWTLGLTQIVLGRLTVVTFAFGAVLIGLGIDFGIHIYNRYLEERGRPDQPSVYKALHTALVRTSEGLLLGALTTALAFFCMFFTSFRGFRELGFVAGSGILCCLVSVILLLPVLVMYLSTQRETRQRFDITSVGLRRLYKAASDYPRVMIILGLVVSVYFTYQARHVRFEESFGALKQPSSAYENLRSRIMERFALPSYQIVAIVTGSTLQGILEKNDRLYDNVESQKGYQILSCDTLRAFLPAVATQRESKKSIRDTVGNRFEPLKERIIFAARKAGLSPMALEPFFKWLARLKDAAEKNEDFILYEDLRDPFIIRLVQGYLVKEGRQYNVVTRIFPPAGRWESSVPQDFLDTISRGAGDVEFTGMAIVTNEIQEMVKRDLAVIILMVTGSVFLLMVLFFGGVRKAIFAIFPVVIGSLWMLGTIRIIGIELNFLNVIVMPMIIGIGVDNGIHLIQRYYERGKDPTLSDLRRAVSRTGRALVMTSLTTIVGFGSLALADFRGIREMGLISILGITYTLIASLILLPALLKIWTQRHTFWDLISREEGEIR
jgi:hypothetical protein